MSFKTLRLFNESANVTKTECPGALSNTLSLQRDFETQCVAEKQINLRNCNRCSFGRRLNLSRFICIRTRAHGPRSME